MEHYTPRRCTRLGVAASALALACCADDAAGTHAALQLPTQWALPTAVTAPFGRFVQLQAMSDDEDGPTAHASDMQRAALAGLVARQAAHHKALARDDLLINPPQRLRRKQALVCTTAPPVQRSTAAAAAVLVSNRGQAGSRKRVAAAECSAAYLVSVMLVHLPW